VDFLRTNSAKKVVQWRWLIRIYIQTTCCSFVLYGFRTFCAANWFGLHALFLFFSGYLPTLLTDNFIVGLTDVSPAVTAPTLWNYDVCGQYPGVVPYESTVKLACTAEMPPRRYLIVQIERANDVLNFCEIEVNVRSK